MKKTLRLKRLWLIALAPIALLLNLAAARYPAFAEWYAVTVYPRLSLAVNAVTSPIPFSLAELLIPLTVLALLACLLGTVIKVFRGKNGRAGPALRFLLNLACAAGAVGFVFVLFCGINYSRYTFAQTSGLPVQPSSRKELTALCGSLAGDVNTLRSKVQTDKNSVMKLNRPSVYATAQEARAAYDRIHLEYPLLRPGYGAPKPVFASRLMSQADITGIFFPFTFEANVNTDIPAYSIPVTMCHELSHLRGYMREDEANFIGYLVCEKSGDTDFEYSGKMLAFIQTSNALYAADPDSAEKIFAGLSDGVRRDLSANTAYWKQFEGPVARFSNSVNDSYLKANRQTDGVKSYGRMVDLLLAEYRQKKKA